MKKETLPRLTEKQKDIMTRVISEEVYTLLSKVLSKGKEKWEDKITLPPFLAVYAFSTKVVDKIDEAVKVNRTVNKLRKSK